MKEAILQKPVVHMVLIIVLSLFAYSNTFQGSFAFDDGRFIVKNPLVKDLSYFPNPLKITGHNIHYVFKSRFMAYFTFALNYKLHGFDVTGYHIFNLLIHIINALLLYHLVIISFKTHFLNKSPIKGYSGYIALSAALLFACHPIQTQAVTYIYQRVASLATMFYLLSLVMYIKARLSSTSASTLTCYAVSFISAVLAMRTKEIAFTLPVMITVYEFMFLRGKIKTRLLYLVPILLTMLIIPLTLINLDKPVGELIGDVSEATKIYSSASRLDYLFTEFRVIMTYIRLIFLPVNQNLDYDYPLYHSLFNPEVLLSFIFILSLFGIGIYLFYRYRDSATHTRLITFGIFWFFITLSVESSIIPIADVINEHRMYLPSAGVFLLLSAAVFTVMEKLKARWVKIEALVVLSLLVIAVVLTGATYARNTVWKDEVTLWEDVVSKSPNKARGQNNLGVAYKSLGLIEKAIKQYQITIRLNPNSQKAYNNLGAAYHDQNLNDKAIKYFKIAIQLKPDFIEAHYNLGIAYISNGLAEKAIEHFKIAIKLRPNFPEAYNNLGITYKFQGLTDKAIEHYQIAIRLKPDFLKAHNNLADAYAYKGLIDKSP